jgi:hypothetical protein
MVLDRRWVRGAADRHPFAVGRDDDQRAGFPRRRLSHCFLLAVPTRERAFVLTDAAINISPDLLAKRDICQNAIDLFVYHLAKQLGALTAVLEGLDALVFTAGIGEKAAAVRERLCRRAAWLGISFDAEANARGGPCITGTDSPVSVWVIPTDEKRMIAMHTRP